MTALPKFDFSSEMRHVTVTNIFDTHLNFLLNFALLHLILRHNNIGSRHPNYNMLTNCILGFFYIKAIYNLKNEFSTRPVTAGYKV